MGNLTHHNFCQLEAGPQRLWPLIRLGKSAHSGKRYLWLVGRTGCTGVPANNWKWIGSSVGQVLAWPESPMPVFLGRAWPGIPVKATAPLITPVWKEAKAGHFLEPSKLFKPPCFFYALPLCLKINASNFLFCCFSFFQWAWFYNEINFTPHPSRCCVCYSRSTA